MNEQEKKSRRNIATTLASQLITTACGIVVPRILIGSFGSEAYGISVSIAQFLSYIMLLEGGIGELARAELYGPLARKDQREISTVYHAVRRFFYYVAAFFLIYSLVLGVFYYDIARVTVFSRPYVFGLVLVIGLTTLAKYMGGLANLTLLAADQKIYVNNVITIGITLINTLTIVILTRNACDLIWVKLGSSLIFVVRPLLYAVYVKKHYHLPKVGKDKEVLAQKWTGIARHIAYFLHRNTDVVLLTLFANARLVAVYAVYSMVVSSIRAIAEASAGGMEAAFGALIAKGQIEALRKAYYRYKVLLTAVTTALFCCTGILIVPFVRLYTTGITDADYIQPVFAVILLTAEAVNCLILPCASLPIAANHIRQTKWGAYGEAAINILLSCLLIQWDPLMGVALGTLIATLFRGVFYMIYTSRHILRVPAYRSILVLLGALLLLEAGIVGGDHLIAHVEIGNYLQWILWGAVTFATVSVPIGAAAYFGMKRRS